MSLFSRLISRAEHQEDEAAPLRLMPKDRGLGSGISAGLVQPRHQASTPNPAPVSRQEDEGPSEMQPARAALSSVQRQAPLHRVKDDEAPAEPARLQDEEARMQDEEASAPTAKRQADTPEPEAAPRRMEDDLAPAPKRIEAEEEAQPKREADALVAPAAVPLRRVDTGNQLLAEQPADELRHDSEGQGLAAKRQAHPAPPSAAPPSLSSPAANMSESAPFAPALTPPPAAPPPAPPQAPASSTAPAPRPKVQIDQIDVIIDSQSGRASSAPKASGARALLARRYVRGV